MNARDTLESVIIGLGGAKLITAHWPEVCVSLCDSVPEHPQILLAAFDRTVELEPRKYKFYSAMAAFHEDEMKTAANRLLDLVKKMVEEALSRMREVGFTERDDKLVQEAIKAMHDENIGQ
jgi:hypothetical protein